MRFIAEPFSIDPHVVVSGGELYLFYSLNDYEAERAGTLVVVDKMLSPTEATGNPKIVVRGTIDEEIFARDRFKAGQHWHTLEGAFYFRVGNWHYITYSGNCYQNPPYYIGYATCYSEEDDLTKLEFHKYPNENTYAPLLRANAVEEGTGHNSVLVEGDRGYIFYHGRDAVAASQAEERRTARVAEFIAKDGVLTITKR